MDGLTVEAGPGVRVNQLQTSLVKLKDEVSAPAPYARRFLLHGVLLDKLGVLGAQVHDASVDGLGAVLGGEVLVCQLAPPEADHHHLHPLEAPGPGPGGDCRIVCKKIR